MPEVAAPRRPSLAGAAFVMMAAFVASRATGLLRDVAVSYQFGTGPEFGAYLAAIRIPDLVFQVTAGGAVASAFIPVFTAYLARGQRDEGWRMVSTLFGITVVVLVPLIAALIALAPELMRLLAPGFRPEYQALAAQLARILMVMPLLFTLGCFTTSVLNSHQRFFLAGLAPTSYNLGIIAGALVFAPYLGRRGTEIAPELAIRGLALGAVLGSLLFLLVQVPGLVRVGMRYRPVIDLGQAGVREVGRLMAPRAVGLAVVQVNFVVSLYFASGIPGGPAALNWAWLLTMLPLGIFAMAISSAVFPTLAAQTARSELAEMRRTVATALRLILFLTIPSSVGLVLLGGPAIRVLFERGLFTPLSTALTLDALRYYAPGLVAMAAVEIVTRAFYALHDTRTPVAVAVGAMLVNGALALLLVGPLGHGGLALATSLAAAAEALALLTLAERRIPGLLGRPVLASVARGAAAALAMAVVLSVYLLVAGGTLASADLLARAGLVMGAVGVGLAVYLAASLALRSDEIGLVLRAVVGRGRV